MKDINDSNITQTVEIAKKFDTDLDVQVQSLLNYIYNTKYGYILSETLFDIPIANILASILSLLFFLFLRKLFADLVIKILHPLTNRTKTAYDNRVLSALKGPISFAFIIIGIKLFFSLLFLNNYTIKTAIYSMIIYNLFWAIYELTYASYGR